jgi:hypothetical protein
LLGVVTGEITDRPDHTGKKHGTTGKFGVTFTHVGVGDPASRGKTRDNRKKEWLSPDKAARVLRLKPGTRPPPRPRAAADEGQSSDGDVDMVGSITEEEEEEHDASGTVDDDRRGKVWIEKKEEEEPKEEGMEVEETVRHFRVCACVRV